jgi:hypothetical protein
LVKAKVNGNWMCGEEKRYLTVAKDKSQSEIIQERNIITHKGYIKDYLNDKKNYLVDILTDSNNFETIEVSAKEIYRLNCGKQK